MLDGVGVLGGKASFAVIQVMISISFNILHVKYNSVQLGYFNSLCETCARTLAADQLHSS